MQNELIKSVSYDQYEILNNIIHLYNYDRCFDLDPCYSKGVFYKDGNIPQPRIMRDINPQFDFVEKGDCRSTGIENSSIESVIFDPPFLATTGKSLTSFDDNNLINKRFSVCSSEDELWSLYKDSIKEFNRILKHNGILVFKCQDKISSGKQYIIHNDIINECINNGFVCEDIFILIAKSRIVADWQLKNQKHARKFHSYFLVFKKKN